MAKPKVEGSLQDAVDTGDLRTSLIAIRDYLVHELEGNRCNACNMSKLRTGDTAALVLRLTKVMEDIEAIPENMGEVSELDAIRARRDGPPKAENQSRTTGTSPQSVRRRQGGRRPGEVGGSSS